MQMKPDLDPGTRKTLEELEAEAGRAANLTRQLLLFSRRSVMQVKPATLNEVVANLLKMLRRLIGEHITVEWQPQPGLPLVEADLGMLEQVIMNLTINARDAMPRSGQLTLSTCAMELEEEDIKLHPDGRPGRFVCLSVADTGFGMDSNTLGRIFEPFFTTKEAGKGTGLGLATVYGIVAQHKGWIEVESEPGKGSTFHVYLPMMSETAKAEKVAAREPVSRGNETILLVEDEQRVRQTIRQCLNTLGYRVLEARTANEALELWNRHGAQIDLLLTDMVMPDGMTGLELAEKLRAQRASLKVIISSGYSAEIVQQGHPAQSGVFYLPKPYVASALAAAVRKCLDQTQE
jgi:two-component system, cell cycle sensor histidine kinase and response regulator CckA